jgi:hypothetical protein
MTQSWLQKKIEEKNIGYVVIHDEDDETYIHDENPEKILLSLLQDFAKEVRPEEKIDKTDDMDYREDANYKRVGVAYYNTAISDFDKKVKQLLTPSPQEGKEK